MKHCVITGAANGIGKALARRFAEADYTVIGIDKDVDRARRAEIALAHTEGKVAFLIGDLGTDEGIEDVVNGLKSIPLIDVFINNAGINAVGQFEHIDMARQQAVIDVNLLAPMLLTRALLRHNLMASKSTLVFISSLSHYLSYPGAAVYAATKDGLASYARSLSVTLAPKDIFVLTVFPGPTRTAHARRYSPDNSREDERMPPERLAEEIYQKVQGRHQHVLIPGVSNTFFALVGRFFPQVAERVMRRGIFDKLGPSP